MSVLLGRGAFAAIFIVSKPGDNISGGPDNTMLSVLSNCAPGIVRCTSVSATPKVCVSPGREWVPVDKVILFCVVDILTWPWPNSDVYRLGWALWTWGRRG